MDAGGGNDDNVDEAIDESLDGSSVNGAKVNSIERRSLLFSFARSSNVMVDVDVDESMGDCIMSGISIVRTRSDGCDAERFKFSLAAGAILPDLNLNSISSCELVVCSLLVDTAFAVAMLRRSRVRLSVADNGRCFGWGWVISDVGFAYRFCVSCMRVGGAGGSVIELFIFVVVELVALRRTPSSDSGSLDDADRLSGLGASGTVVAAVAAAATAVSDSLSGTGMAATQINGHTVRTSRRAPRPTRAPR